MISSNENSYIDFVFGNRTTKVTQNDSIVIYHSEQFWKTINYTTFGQCFTFTPPIWVKALLVKMNRDYKKRPNYLLHFVLDNRYCIDFKDGFLDLYSSSRTICKPRYER